MIAAKSITHDGVVSPQMILCKHCRTPFEGKSQADEFCCHGCAQVYQILSEGGFDKFYELRGDQVLTPLRDTHLEDVEQLDWSWLEEEVRSAELSAREQEKSVVSKNFALGGISCVACIWLIESVLKASDRRVQAFIYASRGSLTLQWPVGEFDVVAAAKNLAECGYFIRPDAKGGTSSLDTQDGLGMRTAICAGLAMNAMVFTLPFYHGLAMKGDLANLFILVAAASATGSLLVGGSWFFKRAFRALSLKQISMEVPIALGLILAYLGSILGTLIKVDGLFYFDFVATFSFLMLLGRWIQHRIMTVHQARMREFDPVPQSVVTSKNQRVNLEDMEVGTRYFISPGQVVPVRSYLVDDKAEFAMDWINGESEPMVKNSGETLPSGARLLGNQKMELKSAELWKDSHVSSLIQEEAPVDLTAGNPFIEKLMRRYLSVVVLIALLGFAYWMVKGREFGPALQVMISVLIVSCPCALGLSIPIADDRASALLKRLGVYVKQMSLFTRLPLVKTLVFDKTGTLSLEIPKLIDASRLMQLEDREREVLNRLVQNSRHPHCLGIREALSTLGLLGCQEKDAQVEEIPGSGVRWNDGSGNGWFLGKPSSVAEKGKTVFEKNGEPVMAFAFEEHLRPQVRETLQYFTDRRFKLRILSGDDRSRVNRMAEHLGIPSCSIYSEMSPQDKGRMIDSESDPVLFLGDGANDIPAFKSAFCRGTPVAERTPATQSVDFYWQGLGFKAIRDLFRVTEMRRSAVRLAFSFSVLYNACVVSISLLGGMSPLWAAVVMPISSLLTIGMVNAKLRARKVRD